MSTINQKKKKFKKINFFWSPALKKNPQLRGRVIRVLTHTPRKPNSALRKVGRVVLSNKKKIFTKIPGSGTLPQKYSIVLVKGKGYKDTPGVKYSMIRGALECLPLFNRNSKRSKYGAENKLKIYIKRALRNIMGSVGIISVIISISIFSLILYWFSILYSFFFARVGKNNLHRDFYECGFRPINDNKVVLDIHFSIVGIIFLIYEMEVILFVPIFLNFYGISFSLYIVILFSLILLGLSYWYEWERYGLSWVF